MSTPLKASLELGSSICSYLDALSISHVHRTIAQEYVRIKRGLSVGKASIFT